MVETQTHPSALANLADIRARVYAHFDPPPDITVSEQAVRTRVLPNAPLNPQAKSWVDNVIVPTLVREYLASEKKFGESLNCDTPMVQCTDIKASPEGGQ
jgi:hypothetical protein